MDNKPFILIIEGTTRPERRSINVANLVLQIGRTLPEIEVQLADPLDFNLPQDGDQIRDAKFSELTERADGFFIIVPEYNHAFSGSLKRFLDSEFTNYAKKPVALAGVSSGPWGGVRAIEALIPVLKALGLYIIQKDVYFPNVKEMFDGNGNLLPEHDKQKEYLLRSFKELVWLANALKTAKTPA